MSLFGRKEQREIDYLQDLLGETLERNEKLANKAIRLEQALVKRDVLLSTSESKIVALHTHLIIGKESSLQVT